MLRCAWQLTVLLLVCSLSATAQEYTYTDLGDFGGDAVAHGINAAGHAVGAAEVGGQLHAFLHDGSLHDLHPPTGRPRSRATDINDLGHVSLTAFGGGANQALLFADGAYVALPDVRDTYALNDSDQVVGQGFFSRWHAYRWSAETGIAEDLHYLTGSTQSTLTSVNESGLACGEAADIVSGGWAREAFCTDGTNIWFVPTLGRAPGTPTEHSIFGLDLDDAGQVVGRGVVATGEAHAFLYDFGTGVVFDIHPTAGPFAGATWSTAHAITNAGLIVGEADGPWGLEPHAFARQGGSWTDLHAFLPAEAVASTARDANESGCVVGSWTDPTGGLHAWRLCAALEELDLRITPRTLNAASRGRWLNGRLRGVAAEDLVADSLRLERLDDLVLGAEGDGAVRAWARGDAATRIKIDREVVASAVIDRDLASDGELSVVVSGRLVDGRHFEARDVIRVRASPALRGARRH